MDPVLHPRQDVQAEPAPAPAAEVTATDWRKALPLLTGGGVSLRELKLSDAGSLVSLLTTEEVSRFISPPPSTLDGFERFILWTQRERSFGRYVCFGIVPDNSDFAVGLIQVRQLEPGFATAEWGFAIGQIYWGSGLFVRSARLAVSFAFDAIGVHRLEARATVQNARGNGVLRKLGATQEGVLRKSFMHRGEQLDQNLWTILADDWAPPLTAPPGPVH
jgi:RimJ/RimL family protein N-acetyltransferase